MKRIRTGRTENIRAHIAANPGCRGASIVRAMPHEAKLAIYRSLRNMARAGILVAEKVDGYLCYWTGRPPITHCLTPEERLIRRAKAQADAYQRRKAARQALREATPAMVLPLVPEPPQNASCEAVETVEQFIARNPSGYQVLPVNWPETLHYGRIPDRIHA